MMKYSIKQKEPVLEPSILKLKTVKSTMFVLLVVAMATLKALVN